MRITIVGGGVFGTSAALECAKRGHRVVLREADTIPAEKAASHDVSKAIRSTYGDKSAFYAPAVGRAREGWLRLERDLGSQLLHPVGFLETASRFDAQSFEYQSAQQLAAMGLPHEVLDRKEIARRFPGFAAERIDHAVLDLTGGWLDADVCVRALATAAARAGAVIFERSPVTDLEALVDSSADAILLAGGPWLARLAAHLTPGIVPTLQHEWFFAPRSAPPEFPVWSHDIATLGYYGFPKRPGDGAFGGLFKVATHVPGRAFDPDSRREPDPEQQRESERFVAEFVPSLEPKVVAHRGCLYANTLDGHFLFDRHPSLPRTYLAGGGSGHGFKFGTVLGEWAANLIEGGPVPREFRRARSPGRTV